MMNIRTLCAGTACALLMGIAPLASAGSMSLNRFRNHALPVLVTVNSQGKVTRIQPAYETSPAVRRLLKSTLSQMITGPSIENGKGVASQAVIQLAVEAVPQNDGRFKLRFQYVKAMPVPYGSWFWNHINGHRLALQSDSGRMHYYRHRHYVPRPSYRWHTRSRTAQPASRSQPVPVQHMAPVPMRQPMPAPRPVPARK